MDQPLLLAALARWPGALRRLWPVVLGGYLANLALLGLDASDGRAGVGAALSELLRAALVLGPSWLGAAAAALVLTDTTPGPLWRTVRERAGDWLRAAAARAVIVYGPLLALAVLAQRGPVDRAVGQANPLPLLALLLIPLALNLAALLALLPAAAVEPRQPLGDLLQRARALADIVYVDLLVVGGGLCLAIALTSFLPAGRPLYCPNHLLGSLLWVYLALARQRAARRLAEA